MCVCARVCVFISPFSSNLSSLLARCPPGPRAFQKSLSKNFMRRESFSSSVCSRGVSVLYVVYTYTLNVMVSTGTHCFPFNSQEEYLQRVRVIDL